jgi:hypothetical protein
MIKRDRARKRISIPSPSGFIYKKGVYEDKIVQSLITHTKMGDEIPELPDHTEFVSDNRLTRAITYPQVHLGEKWGIWTKVPTSASYISLTNVSIPGNTEKEMALHSSLGEFVWCKLTANDTNWEIALQLDGNEIYRRKLPDLGICEYSDFYDGIAKIIANETIDGQYGIYIKERFTYRNTFRIVVKNNSGTPLTIRTFESLALIHEISW